ILDRVEFDEAEDELPGLGIQQGSVAVALQPVVTRAPFFCVGGAPGTVLYMLQLTRAIGRQQPFFGLQAPGLSGDERPLRRVEELAARYLAEVRAIQPRGPYCLGGHSFGGLVAFEMAQQLRQQGEGVAHLVLMDTAIPEGELSDADRDVSVALVELVRVFTRVLGTKSLPPPSDEDLLRLDPEVRRELLAQRLSSLIPPGFPVQSLLDVYLAHSEAMGFYAPRPYDGPALLLRATEGFPPGVSNLSRGVRLRFDAADLGWGPICPALRVVEVAGDHFSMLLEPHVDRLAAVLRGILDGTPSFEIQLPPPPQRSPNSARRVSVETLSERPRPPMFDPFDADYVRDPYPMLSMLRSQDPVHWSPLKVWCVSRFRDVQACLRDRRFSADSRNRPVQSRMLTDAEPESYRPSSLSAWFRTQQNTWQDRLFNNMMMFLDPPQHARLRKLVAGVFDVSAMRRWRDYIQDLTESLVREACARGEFDVTADLALPLPISVISRILGVPEDDVPMILGWAEDLTNAMDPLVSNRTLDRANQAIPEFFEYIRDHIQRRREVRREDLLQAMMEAESDGDRLSDDELVANCILLYTAGFETTTNMIGNGLLALLRNRPQLELLRQNPELIDDAVEELLRYDSPVRQAYRTATENIELGGKTIGKGDSVLFLFGAANRDPSAFPNPDQLDIRRGARHHVAFGHGGHYCLGAPLARLEIQIAISTVIRLLPDIEPVSDGLVWRKSATLRGLERFPVEIRRAR
ncbi:MAG TPA: cytochrome P450, partial [Candidatus Nanopelagicales bacterium]|nr:cytochrome P450 [Candidatus Nanopelagicales bacterium]